MSTERHDAVVNWTELRARLDDVNRAVDGALTPVAATVERVLEERARRLAESAEEPTPIGDLRDVLTFELGRERLALETRFLSEVVVPARLSRVPRAPAWLVGVLSLRGRTLPACDLRLVLGLGAARRDAETERLLILGKDQPEVAALVESVHEILTVDFGGLQASSAALELAGARVLGVTQDALVVLDGEAVLADEQLRA